MLCQYAWLVIVNQAWSKSKVPGGLHPFAGDFFMLIIKKPVKLFYAAGVSFPPPESVMVLPPSHAFAAFEAS